MTSEMAIAVQERRGPSFLHPIDHFGDVTDADDPPGTDGMTKSPISGAVLTSPLVLTVSSRTGISTRPGARDLAANCVRDVFDGDSARGEPRRRGAPGSRVHVCRPIYAADTRDTLDAFFDDLARR
jgi:hypothetical protein